MDYTLALVLSLLQVSNLCTAAPLPAEVVIMKSKVKWMAEKVVARVDNDVQFPPIMTQIPSPTTDDVYGLSTVVMVLDGYNNLISDTLQGAAQVKSDISSLTGYLSQWYRSQWSQGHCSEQRPKPPLPSPLLKLQQSQQKFVITVGMEALYRVKEFLVLLLKNLDRLETC